VQGYKDADETKEIIIMNNINSNRDNNSDYSGEKKKKKRPSMEDSTKETREIIKQRQITSERLRQKFTALAERESDPFRKAAAEDLAAIHFTITTLWHDIEMLYVFEYTNQEKFNLLSKFIFGLPEVVQNQVIFTDMIKKMTELDKRIKNNLLGSEQEEEKP